MKNTIKKDDEFKWVIIIFLAILTIAIGITKYYQWFWVDEKGYQEEVDRMMRGEKPVTFSP